MAHADGAITLARKPAVAPSLFISVTAAIQRPSLAPVSLNVAASRSHELYSRLWAPRKLSTALSRLAEEQLQRPITPDYTTKILSRRLEHASIPSHWPLATPTISLAHTRRLFRSPLPATQHDKPAERCAHVVVHDGAQAELYVRDYLIRIGPIPTNGPSGFEDELGSNAIQQKISKTSIENENNALLKYHPNLQGGSSTERLSAVGKPRGYVIYPGHSPIDNTVFDFKRLWNMHAPDDPVINFYKFFDSKNITQADLVAWVNVSVYHLPQNEDPSNTRTKLTVSSFFLMPLNLDFYDVFMDSTNSISFIAPTKPAMRVAYDSYGVAHAHCIRHHPAARERWCQDVRAGRQADTADDREGERRGRSLMIGAGW
ncbi:hypothetical protein L227DRAFT_616296 [Lentinus tigrinus ALCF2SS1-6]|uniref:Copper amine oxidase catalytic domain-containing protein n=1 Tax=Lentinus tigrinus ALCF2SS1-6 TaxID=1328759 RepID=A0A5C2RUN7_9APHY|nr:hypothetical protein L227DRAFT_616296 [Lentinus tigrinus ALCF2SS1-6]